MGEASHSIERGAAFLDAQLVTRKHPGIGDEDAHNERKAQGVEPMAKWRPNKCPFVCP